MTYHLLYYEQITDLDRVSYYFVYAFFIISGFSLYLTYRDRMSTLEQLRVYAVKRFRRIAPLFWFAVLIYVLLIGVPAKPWTIIAMNLALAFGFTNPGSTSMLTGGWSIGIEMVFYLCLPLLTLIGTGSLRRLTILSLISVVSMVAFVNATLAGHPTMREVWVDYTQPWAFFGYFAVGCLLGEIYLRRPDAKGQEAMVLAAGARALLVCHSPIGLPQRPANWLDGFPTDDRDHADHSGYRVSPRA